MTTRAARNDDHAWEKEHAPKIGRSRVLLAAAFWLAWIGFLVWVGFDRWFGTLQ